MGNRKHRHPVGVFHEGQRVFPNHSSLDIWKIIKLSIQLTESREKANPTTNWLCLIQLNMTNLKSEYVRRLGRDFVFFVIQGSHLIGQYGEVLKLCPRYVSNDVIPLHLKSDQRGLHT